MDLSLYWETPLEQWIAEAYQKKGFTAPEDLDIDRLASSFGVDVVYHKGRTAADNKLCVIFLNNERDSADIKQSFFHEFGHVLRHSGDQRKMPELFRQQQEYDAAAFMLYSSIPFFILKELPLPSNLKELISYISKVFDMPLEIAEKRVQQISQRISHAQLFATTTEYEDTSPSVDDDYSTSEPPSIMRVSAYYDHYGDFSRPHTFILEIPHGFDGLEEVQIDVNKNYKACGLPERLPCNAAVVLPTDLSLYKGNNGLLSLNISRILWRHGSGIKTLYLPMEAAEDALNF